MFVLPSPHDQRLGIDERLRARLVRSRIIIIIEPNSSYFGQLWPGDGRFWADICRLRANSTNVSTNSTDLVRLLHPTHHFGAPGSAAHTFSGTFFDRGSVDVCTARHVRIDWQGEGPCNMFDGCRANRWCEIRPGVCVCACSDTHSGVMNTA